MDRPPSARLMDILSPFASVPGHGQHDTGRSLDHARRLTATASSSRYRHQGSVRGARDGTASPHPPIHWSRARGDRGLEEETTGSAPLELRCRPRPIRRWWGGTASTSRRREAAARGAGGERACEVHVDVACVARVDVRVCVRVVSVATSCRVVNAREWVERVGGGARG